MVKEGYKKTKYGLIPDSWDFLQLKDIAKVNMGSSPPSSTYNEDGDGLPFFQGNAEFGSIYPEENQWCTDPQKVADKDNILISVRAPVGDINIAPYKCCIGRGLAAIEGEETSNKFIYYCLKQFNPKLQSYSQGSTFSSINKKVLETFFVNYPPLTEQKKIASILSSVDKAIEKTDEIIEETKELKKGLMQQLLTKGIGHSEFKEVRLNTKKVSIPLNWEVKKLEQLVKIKNGNSPSKFDFSEEGEHPFIKVNDMNFAYKYIAKADLYFNESKYDLVNPNTIIFPKRGAAISTNKINILSKKAYYDTNVMGLITNDKLVNEYLYYYIQDLGLWQFADTTSIPQINNKHIYPLLIPYPKLEEQKKIASILSSVDDKIQKEEEYKAKLERLKKGLMQKLLTGEIRVNTDMGV